MKFSSIISAALLLVTPSLVSAAPAAPAELAAPAVHKLQRRACPTVATIQEWIRNNANVGDNTVFYTAGAGARDAQFFAGTLSPAGTYWSEVFVDADGQPQYLNWIEECGTPEEQNTLFPRMGEALARESTGTAYVLMPPGGAIAAFWSDNEYPYLNGRVTITAVNSADTSQQQAYVHPNNPF